MNWKTVVGGPKNDLGDVGMDAVSIVERYSITKKLHFLLQKYKELIMAGFIMTR